MFRPKSNQGQPAPASNKVEIKSGPSKLPKLSAEPALDHLHTMMNTAKKNGGHNVEQQFSVEGQDSLFQLCVSVPANSDPIWKFSKMTLKGLTEVWSHPTIDVVLIHNLILSECTGKQSTELIAESTPVAKATTGNFSSGSLAALDPPLPASLPPASAPPPEAIAAAPKYSVSLEGDLEKMALAAVLQSLALTKMTGRLEIIGPDTGAEIFLVDGQPCHATTGEATGNNAIIELLSWEKGKFRLLENERPTVTTINKRLETLLMEGVTLLDQYKHLTSIGINLDAYLVQAYTGLSELQFENTVRQGPPTSMQGLKDLFMEIEDPITLYDLLRRMPMTKAEWVPLLFNLTLVGLVSVAKEKPQVLKAPEAKVAPDVGLDETSIQAALRAVQRPETEVFTYPILQYLVKQEAARFAVDAKPFALIVFDLMQGKNGNLQPLPLTALRVAIQRLRELLREIDIIGHFETLDYAILLPQTSGRSATVVAQRLAEKLKAEPIDGLGDQINICFGVAAAPQDTSKPGGLIAAAAEAKKNARKNNLLVVEYRTMT